jgi:hypothetical protein
MKSLLLLIFISTPVWLAAQSYYDIVYNNKENINNSNNPFAYIFEDFEDTLYPPRYWKFPTGITKWSRAEVSAYNLGEYSLKFSFYDAYSADSIVLPLFINNGNYFLKFDYAHAPGQQSDDKLLIEFSSDNGSSYDSSYLMRGNNGGELNTAPWQLAPFVPDSSQWRTKNISLRNNVNKIRFTVINGWGNNLYLDNIQVGEIANKDADVYNVDINKFVLPGEFTPKYTVKNYGKDTISFNVKLTIGSYESRTTVTDLPPGTKKQIFGEPFNILPGDYKAVVSTLLLNDQNKNNDTLSYNFYIINSEWQQGDTMPYTSSMASCSSVMLNDTGYVIISGGHTPNNVYNLSAIYNISTNTWQTLPVLPEKKLALASAVAGNYYFAISGASSSYDSLKSPKVYALDLKTRTWERRTDMPIALALHRAVSYQDSLIYVLGGDYHLANNHRIFLYNTNEDSWRELDSFQMPSLAGALTIFKNRIIYVGGADLYSAYSTTYIGEIQPDHRIIWHQGADYPGGKRFRWNAAPWGEKGVIVLNGCKSAYWASENECYLYNPETDSWHIMPPKNFNTCGTSIASIKIKNQMKLFALGGYIGADLTNYNEILTDSITVPVELNNFTSSTAGNSVTLFWSTATEKNNYGFEIERKSLNNDYMRIGFNKGKGTTTEINNYAYTDKNLPSGIYMYRLKQRDLNGEYKYYNLAGEIKIGQPAAYSLSQNYPNPFNPSTRIKYSIKNTVPVKIEIYDILGRKTATIVNEIKQPGEYEFSFNGNNLASGIYFYKLTAGTFTQIRKMQMLK